MDWTHPESRETAYRDRFRRGPVKGLRKQKKKKKEHVEKGFSEDSTRLTDSHEVTRTTWSKTEMIGELLSVDYVPQDGVTGTN